MSSNQKYQLFGQEFKSQAFEIYRRMRLESPVFRHPGADNRTPIWFVTGYAEVDAVLRNDKVFSRDMRCAFSAEQVQQMIGPTAHFDFVNKHMLNCDGDDHQRLRALVSKAFTPKRISELQPRVQLIANELLDAVVDDKAADLVEVYAFPLPIIVIAELLGVPADDRHLFRLWSNEMVSSDTGPEAVDRGAALMQAFFTYMGTLIGERRQRPQDDLISDLLQAEEAGDRLSEHELYSMVSLLITAGHETMAGLITNSTLALLQNPEQLAVLRNEPSLTGAAIEEFLRYDGPAERAKTRFVTESTTLGGQVMARGDIVVAVLASADHDETIFEDGDRLDITREVNKHLAFGRGIHYCLGASLARMEGEIALRTMLDRLPGLRLAVSYDELRWRESAYIRALEALPVQWD